MNRPFLMGKKRTAARVSPLSGTKLIFVQSLKWKIIASVKCTKMKQKYIQNAQVERAQRNGSGKGKSAENLDLITKSHIFPRAQGRERRGGKDPAEGSENGEEKTRGKEG